MNDEPVKIPYISVHPNYLAVYEKLNYNRCIHTNVESSLGNLKKNIHHNKISDATEKKIKRSCNYLLLNSTQKNNYTKLNWKELRFNVTFITLTLSAQQMHSDNYIKKYMLNQFLIQAQRLWNVDQYVWRAEKQANGNVHFHILTDKFIPWYELRSLWNNIQRKEGYIEVYRTNQKEYHKNGFQLNKELLQKWSYSNQLKAYHTGVKTNWSNPNSTDIHGLRNIGNASAYIVKYMSKDEKKNHTQVKASAIQHQMRVQKNQHTLSSNVLKFLRDKAQIGRLWSCSRDLSNLQGGGDVITESIKDELSKLNDDQSIHKFADDYYSIFCASYEDLIRNHCVGLVQMLSEFMVNHFIIKSHPPDEVLSKHSLYVEPKVNNMCKINNSIYIQSVINFN